MPQHPDPIFRLAAALGLLVASGTTLVLLPQGDDLALLGIRSALALALLFGAIYSGFTAWQWSRLPPVELERKPADEAIVVVQSEEDRRANGEGVLYYDTDHATATPIYRSE